MIRSLQTRLLLAMIGSMALMLILFGVLIYWSIHHAVWQSFDDGLTSAARVLAASVEWEEEALELEFDDQKARELQGAGAPLRFQFWRDDGTVMLRSASLEESDLPRFHGEEGQSVFRDLKAPNNRMERLTGLRFAPRVDRPKEVTVDRRKDETAHDPAAADTTDKPYLVLVVAEDGAVPLSQLKRLRWLLFMVGAATLAASLVVSFFVARRGFRPLRSLAAQIAEIREDELTARVRAGDLPSEIVPVVDRLNSLLERLQTAFTRERSFTADVAHELRTPLAGVRTTLEVALTTDRSAGEYKEALVDCLAIALSMQGMVENLLALARLDAGQFSFRTERVLPAALLDRTWQSVAGQATTVSMTLENRIPPDLTLTTDPDAFEMVFRNLVENAVAHGGKGNPIFAEARVEEGAVHLTLSNSGSTLTEEEAALAFHRFWRGDPSRKNTGAHCGLGLALVKRIITSLGGEASIQVSKEGIFTLCLVIPCAVYLPRES